MPELAHSQPLPSSFIVACLCAEWCDVCRSYRSRFEKVGATLPGVQFVWIDVEDEFEMMGSVEVDNFPTIMIIANGEPRFFGAISPQTETLMRLVKSHVSGSNVAPLVDDDLRKLSEHIAALQ